MVKLFDIRLSQFQHRWLIKTGAWMALLLTTVLGVTHVVQAEKMTASSNPKNPVTASATPPVTNQEVPFGDPVSPDRCKSGKKGYIYWAAREHVFAFRFDPAKPLYPRKGNLNVMADEFVPTAPALTEPEGCYGNPLRGGSVPYLWDYSAELFEKLAGRRISPYVGPYSHSQFAIRDQLQLRNLDGNEFNRRMFLKGKDCRQSESGLTECQISVGQPTEYNTQIVKLESKLLFNDANEMHDIYVLIKADNASHVSWKDGKAPSGVLPNGKVLESTIDLYGAVRLHDNFRIFPHELELLVPYYRSMIRYVTDAHVTAYPWTPNTTK